MSDSMVERPAKWRAMLVGAVFGLALGSGGWLVQRSLAQGHSTPTVNGGRLLQQVMSLVQDRYVETVSTDSIYRLAMVGMLAELDDPHTVFLSARRLDRFREQTSGQYAGIGARIDPRDGTIVVIAPVPGSPAEQAGLVTGDRITRIDTTSTRGMTSDEALVKLRGAVGSMVRLQVERAGVATPLTFLLRREVVRVSSVGRVTMLEPGVGYLDVGVFGDSTEREVARGVDSLVRLGMKSLVLDLRGNPGGLLEQGTAVADLFLDRGQPLVRMVGHVPEATRIVADTAPQRWPNLPIVVLVDRGSASAAEIVAGALQDHDRAVVVGVTSFGKGSAQTVYDMAPAGALKLTTSLWYTPVGRSITIRRRADSARTAVDDADPDSAVVGDTAVARRVSFRTDKGRVVYGGGGITPDVIVRDSVATAQGAALQAALGKDVPKFRDALTALALRQKSMPTIATPTFTVTPLMRSAVRDELAARGVTISDSLFSRTGAVVDRLIGYEFTRYVFGREAEFARRSREDPVMLRALALLRNTPTRADLLARASAAHPSKADGSE
jgi:carboxyl-terminal processing protease